MAIRINPYQLTGQPAGTGLGNAIGPYRFRGGVSMKSVRISANSNNATDVCKIWFTEPGVALGVNTAETPSVTNLGTLTCPFSIVLDAQQMGNQCDIYVSTTTQTGTPTVFIERVP